MFRLLRHVHPCVLSDGIITEQDFLNYKVKVTPTLSMTLKRSLLTIQTLPPPSSGVIYGFMLRLLEGIQVIVSSPFCPSNSFITVAFDLYQ